MKCMDQLPAVTTCCFCCFLRAGNAIIAALSFSVGMLLAPNVGHTKYPWHSGIEQTAVEVGVQTALGVVSILLAICSILLFIGSICGIPILIEVYQWGAVVYGCSTTCMYIILACFCFLVHSSIAAGSWLVVLVFVNSFLTIYFIIVANSLRMSLLFLHSTELMY